MAEKRIKEVADELNVNLMTDEELKSFTEKVDKKLREEKELEK